MTQPRVYRVWEGYSNDATGNRSEICRILAICLDDALKWVRKNLKLPRDCEEDGDDETAILEWYRKREETTHYIGIEQTDFTDPLSNELPPFDKEDVRSFIRE